MHLSRRISTQNRDYLVETLIPQLKVEPAVSSSETWNLLL